MAVWWRRFALLIFFYLLLRILFLLFNTDAFSSVPVDTLLAAFVEGIRFDLAIVATINGPLWLIHLLRNHLASDRLRLWFDHLISILFIGLNLPLICIGVIDSRMFAFTGRRASPDIFSISTDINQQGLKIIVQYWWITLPTIILCILFALMSYQRSHALDHASEKVWLYKFLRMILLVAGCTLASRGGLQRKPLAPAHAYTWQPPVLANLVLNSGMTLLRSPPSEALSRYHDFQGQDEIRQLLTPPMSAERVALAPGKNVVILVVESLASEYVGALNQGTGYTPFLDSLMERSIVFRESFANGRRSIDAMPAIFAAVPAWRDQPYVTSAFTGNDVQALPRILKMNGYSTYFFHGAANGSMHFDVFSAVAGIDHYIGQSEYPDHRDTDGTWGIYDEPFLKFTAQQLNAAKKPFFAGIFTLSSHNPFTIPEKYQGRFPKGTLPIHESIGYADYAIGEFFKTIEKMPWYANTLFIITGDHTSLSDKSQYNNFLGRFRVPIFIFDPTSSLPLIGRSKIAQHLDITPTVLDLLDLNQSKPTLAGWSLFDPAYSGRFTQYEYGQWVYYDQETLLTLSDSGVLQAFLPTDVVFERPTTVDESKVKILKAKRQYYANGLIENSWHR